MATDEFSAATARQQASALLPQKYLTCRTRRARFGWRYNAADF
ncbi:MAG: hypothetical protein ACRDTA_00405 [Pseudonocardiaceae bacterium]